MRLGSAGVGGVRSDASVLPGTSVQWTTLSRARPPAVTRSPLPATSRPFSRISLLSPPSSTHSLVSRICGSHVIRRANLDAAAGGGVDAQRFLVSPAVRDFDDAVAVEIVDCLLNGRAVVWNLDDLRERRRVHERLAALVLAATDVRWESVMEIDEHAPVIRRFWGQRESPKHGIDCDFAGGWQVSPRDIITAEMTGANVLRWNGDEPGAVSSIQIDAEAQREIAVRIVLWFVGGEICLEHTSRDWDRYIQRSGQVRELAFGRRAREQWLIDAQRMKPMAPRVEILPRANA